ncbi:hypothetical protein [Fibrivirga algicola]|uniref:hypothetical protein n=1 Tax=Fibrivirga algicola TaxID=2950420 RepID=UPI000A17BE4C|nr:hypothetical protein [Fibrivirga algicola]ARK10211.1 hypothetical protein A6C57_07625 [Fibrella sp. ES10-3-2-2]
MKKTQYTLLLALSTIFYVLTSCKGTEPAVPVADRIKNNYVAASVLEGSTTVYTSGGTSNTKPGYSQFRLNLSNPPAVTYTAVDGSVFTGTYTVVGDNQIVLSGLTPQPSGTNGTITFTITNLADGTVTLTRTTPDQKTGNTTNVYNLRKG